MKKIREAFIIKEYEKCMWQNFAAKMLIMLKNIVILILEVT
jgi:hypothetical protein